MFEKRFDYVSSHSSRIWASLGTYNKHVKGAYVGVDRADGKEQERMVSVITIR